MSISMVLQNFSPIRFLHNKWPPNVLKVWRKNKKKQKKKKKSSQTHRGSRRDGMPQLRLSTWSRSRTQRLCVPKKRLDCHKISLENCPQTGQRFRIWGICGNKVGIYMAYGYYLSRKRLLNSFLILPLLNIRFLWHHCLLPPPPHSNLPNIVIAIRN